MNTGRHLSVHVRTRPWVGLLFGGLLVAGGLLYGPELQAAPPVTNINIGTEVVQPNVKRLGINLGSPDFWDSGQMMKNLIFGNEGFEGQLYQSTVNCLSGTSTSCVDADQWSGWPAGFWNGASFEVIWGVAKGRTGTVSQTLAPSSGHGVTLQFGSSGTTIGAGDWIVLRHSMPGSATAGWWTSSNGTSSTFTTQSSDLAPNNPGIQNLSINASGSGSATLSSYFDDGVPNQSFVQITGPYQVQFQAKSTGGNTSVSVLVQRLASQNINYLEQNVQLTNEWATYTLPFNGTDNGSQTGAVQLQLSLSGGSMLVDTVSVIATAGDPTNLSVFRDPVVQTLRTLNPGLLRYWSGQLGDTLDNQLLPEFQRQVSGYSAYYTSTGQIQIGLHDFLVLCKTIGVEPWYVVPITFSTTEMTNLIQYLQGDSSTPYGAKRAALGQSSPWTSVFHKIHLEFGNEAWNSAFAGGNLSNPVVYGNRAADMFSTARAYPGYLASSFDLVAGGQAVNSWLNQQILASVAGQDSLAVAPYQMYEVDSYSNNQQLYGPTFAEPQWDVSPAGITGQNAVVAQAANTALSVYEVNLSTDSGSIDQSTLTTFTPSLGAGIAVAENMMLMLKMGIQNQMLFALPQWSYQISDGDQARLWGAVVDMGVSNRKRPQYLALQLANQGIAGDLLQTTQSGANPSWNQQALNGIPATTVQTILSYAFSGANGTQSVLLFNLDLANQQSVTFTGTGIPGGNVSMTQLASANPTDNNETSQVVGLTTKQLSNFSSSSPLVLPPYSMTLLTYQSGSSGGQFSTMYINAGGPTYTDQFGETWLADYGYSGATSTFSTTKSIANTSEDPIYQDQRAGSAMVYQYSVPNGTYQVKLKFAELQYSAPGQRIFNVIVNGQWVDSHLDVFSLAGGAFTQLCRTYTVIVTNGQITINLTSVVNPAIINAIQINAGG